MKLCEKYTIVMLMYYYYTFAREKFKNMGEKKFKSHIPDVDTIDVLIIPERLEKDVPKAQQKHILLRNYRNIASG